ncbi:uncharacterized protein M6B38_311330 [Iris pallida]|uniref:Uncharacterized protein n=1 Tax=Iris pallida TaxID=29817 RepID=A0AAX6HEM0_IRIPA|nr:uncharacterized protein M6B38_315025 [Iris pallida]KAJ6839968.1 uncharacterized protein M6B38_311330 [Iris pallida]
MAKSFSSIPKILNPISETLPRLKPRTRSHVSFRIRAAARSSSFSNREVVQVRRNLRKDQRPRRRLIKISTTDGRWHGEWICEYVFSLRDLQLADLAEDGQQDTQVFISLTIQKHAGFGFSIDGRIVTSLNRKCSCCISSYCQEIDTTFDVWVLPSGKDSEPPLSAIGGTDPSLSDLCKTWV